MYIQKVKRFKFYNENDIISLHKFAYYGNKERFELLVNNNLVDQFLYTLYYCIDEGCKRNYEFAKYIKENYVFENKEYEKSITSTFLKKGIFNDKLFIDKYNYNLYGGFPKSSVNKLIKFKELHPLLSIIISTNNWNEFREDIKDIDKETISTLVYCHNINNLFNIKVEDHLSRFRIGKKVDTARYLPVNHKLYQKSEFDKYIFKYSTAEESRDYNIENFEQEFLIAYKIEKYVEEFKETSLYSIHNNIQIAIYNYHNSKNINDCISKFVSVSPKLALEYVEKHKPFLKISKNPFELDIIDKYKNINKNYVYQFLYSQILFFKFDYKQLELLDGFIEYSLIEATIKSSSNLAFKMLKKYYEENKKCYKIVDYENEKFIEEKELIELDFEDIEKKMKFDPEMYINNNYYI